MILFFIRREKEKEREKGGERGRGREGGREREREREREKSFIYLFLLNGINVKFVDLYRKTKSNVSNFMLGGAIVIVYNYSIT